MVFNLDLLEGKKRGSRTVRRSEERFSMSRVEKIRAQIVFASKVRS
jgi:hypothetical protein